MPVYEYVCRDCGEHVEVVQSFRESPLTTCGVCGGSLRKVFSAAGIIFKGSGYYVTDTRKKPSSSDDTAGKKEGGKKEGADATTGGGKKEGADATTGGGKKDAGGGGKGSGSRTAESA